MIVIIINIFIIILIIGINITNFAYLLIIKST